RLMDEPSLGLHKTRRKMALATIRLSARTDHLRPRLFNANQRKAVTNADGSFWLYGYDQLGQVTSGKKYFSDGIPVPGEQFEYSFDDIGNRKYAGEGGNEFGTGLRYQTYTGNNLNQYTQRTVPGKVDVVGTAGTNSTVTVNQTPTY